MTLMKTHNQSVHKRTGGKMIEMLLQQISISFSLRAITTFKRQNMTPIVRVYHHDTIQTPNGSGV